MKSAIATLIICIIALGIYTLVHKEKEPVLEPASSKQAPQEPVTDQYKITANDNGKIFSYPLTSRFSIVLDATAYPKERTSVTNESVIGAITNTPDVAAGSYALTYETIAPGTTLVRNGDFSVTILVTE